MKKFKGFFVKGKPFFPLGAQAHNSSSYSREMFKESCIAALALNCNTVEAPIYWEIIEKQEGIFDFTCIDYMLELCRENDLKLILLWFASWKNGDMSFAPGWVKRDQQRFQRVLRSDKTPVANLSAHYTANQEADAKAFAAVCSYLKETDGEKNTVIAVQVENEPGYFKTDRDYSENALKNYKNTVPAGLLNYLSDHCEAPAYKDWEKYGKKQALSWEETFGFHGFEYCEAWHLAKYIDGVALKGREKYNIPLYVNVWLNDGTPWGVPGIEYPGGGAVIRTLHIWLAAMENIDLIAPDIYEQNCYRFKEICDFYNNDDNALFIPESSRNISNACNMFYAIASGAAGYSSFGAESCIDNEGKVIDSAIPVRDSNLAVKNIMPLLLKHMNTGKIYPVVPYTDQEDQGFEFEEFLGTVNFKDNYGFYDYRSRRYITTQESRTSRGLIIEDEKRCFFLTGRFCLRLALKSSPEISMIASQWHIPDFISIEEGHFDESGNFITDCIRNGDEASFGGFWTAPECGIVRVKLL